MTPCLSINSSTTKQASSTKSNILRDGTLIDLCGATLLWRSVESLQKTPTKPNNLRRLNLQLLDRIPMIYLKCGRAHGQHDWGVKNDNKRQCPLCRTLGSYVQLLIGLKPNLYTDINSSNNNSNLFKTYAFWPCGHMASEKTCN